MPSGFVEMAFYICKKGINKHVHGWHRCIMDGAFEFPCAVRYHRCASALGKGLSVRICHLLKEGCNTDLSDPPVVVAHSDAAPEEQAFKGDAVH
jgi:hypothetical protein